MKLPEAVVLVAAATVFSSPHVADLLLLHLGRSEHQICRSYESGCLVSGACPVLRQLLPAVLWQSQLLRRAEFLWPYGPSASHAATHGTYGSLRTVVIRCNCTAAA